MTCLSLPTPRINLAPTVGYEEDVGSHTTHHFMPFFSYSVFSSHLPSLLYLPPHLFHLSPQWVLH